MILVTSFVSGRRSPLGVMQCSTSTSTRSTRWLTWLDIMQLSLRMGSFTGSESKECAMLRDKVLGDTVLERRQLLLKYDAAKDGWNAGAFHAKCDNQGPAFLIARTKEGAYFGAFNPLAGGSLSRAFNRH